MDESNKQEMKQFAVIFYGLAEEYAGKISKPGIRLKFEALKEYDIETISKAASFIIQNRENTFPAIPTVKEFIDAIDLMSGPKISMKSMASVQVDTVLSVLKHEGSYSKYCFEDKITDHLMTVRWPFRQWASSVLTSEIVWFRREFIEAYLSYSECVDKGLDLISTHDGLKQLASNITKRIEE